MIYNIIPWHTLTDRRKDRTNDQPVQQPIYRPVIQPICEPNAPTHYPPTPLHPAARLFSRSVVEHNLIETVGDYYVFYICLRIWM